VTTGHLHAGHTGESSDDRRHQHGRHPAQHDTQRRTQQRRPRRAGTENASEREIVVDPVDGDLVGERSVTVDAVAAIPPGTVIGATTWTRTLVDEVPASVRAAVVDQNCTASADGMVTCAPAT
jgi:hypothetical protein